MTMYEIKHRFTDIILFKIESGSLKLALEAAVKKNINLRGAYLAGARLRSADLRSADLHGADLYGAVGINPYLCTPLLMLLDQSGPIRAYKLVNKENEGIYNGGLKYEIGQTVEVTGASEDTKAQCAAGINLGTLNWCMQEWQKDYRILVCEFNATDIAAIPTATDGKFRVHRCKVVGEKDLEEIGLIGKEKGL